MKKLISSLLIILFCLKFNDICSGQKVECVLYTRKSNHTTSSMFTEDKSAMDTISNVKFYLFTRRNPSCSQELKLNDKKTLLSSMFNALWPTRFVIHGWKNDLHSEMNDFLRSAYLYRGFYNIIIVDWGNIAYDINYDRVARKINTIGTVISEFIIFLHNTTGLSYDNIYLIGHSLGAHIAGAIGHQLRNKINQQINTIVALDPAEPYFKDVDIEHRIDPSDAKYVEGIHTDIGLLGFQNPIGHADFYPNYGRKQLGCENKLKTCSHSRAYQYFAESINSKKGFWSIRCQNLNDILQQKCVVLSGNAVMGGEPIKPKNGIFYLPINSRPLYAKGDFTKG